MTERNDREARIAERLRRRHRAERRFRVLGLAAILLGLGFLGVLFATVLNAGASAFQQTAIKLDLEIAAPAPGDDPSRLDYQALVKKALREAFPDATTRREKRELYRLVSSGARFELRRQVLADPDLTGRPLSLWLTASDEVDMVIKNAALRRAPPEQRRLSDRQLAWAAALEAEGRIEARFNRAFFFNGDSREPELAGIAVAVVGSLLSLLVCLALAFPLGVLTAVYLEEFAPRTRWTEFLEVNINNLAAALSIVFGLLGLAVFLNFFELPRSAPARSRRCSTTSCRSPCPACWPAPSSAPPEPWAKPRPCSWSAWSPSSSTSPKTSSRRRPRCRCRSSSGRSVRSEPSRRAPPRPSSCCWHSRS
jgi:phosphate transport system permease protein